MTERRLVLLSPDHKYRYALTDNLSKVNYAGTNETLRERIAWEIIYAMKHMDQNMPTSLH